MRIVLTGASGYLGQHILVSLLRLLVQEETNPHSVKEVIEVQAIYNSASKFDESVQRFIANWTGKAFSGTFSVKTQQLDLSNERQVNEWMNQNPLQNHDVCIHTAAISSPKLCEENPTKHRAVNIPDFFFRELCKKGAYVIALSSDQVYCGKKAPYREEDPVEPCNAYGRSKVDMENLLLGLFGERCSLLRSSIILGPKAPIDPSIAHETFLHFIETRNNKETTFWTDEKRSVVAVGDVIRTVQYMLIERLSGIFNMGGPESVSRYDIAETVFKYLKYDPSYLIAQSKADLIQSPETAVSVPSPLDISMNCEKLHSVVGPFLSLRDIVQVTFSPDVTIPV